MKRSGFVIVVMMNCFLMQAEDLTADEQLKLDIEACWNEHEKTMGKLQNAFKKSEEGKKQQKIVPDLVSKKELETYSVEVVEKTENIEDVVMNEAVSVDTNQNVSMLQAEHSIKKSKSLLRAELELKELQRQ